MGGVSRTALAWRKLARHSIARYGLASVFPRLVGSLGMLVITPVALEQLGVANFALWILATYVSGLVVSPDLGIGNGIVNEFGSSHERGISLHANASRIRGLIKLLGIVALTWLFAGSALAYMYSLSSDNSLTLFVSLALGLFCFLSAVPASVVQRIQLSHEKASTAVLWEGVGKTTALGLSLAVLVWFPNLYLLIVAYMLPVSIFSWLNAVLFLRSHGIPRVGKVPTIADAVRENRHAFSLGKWFLVMQVAYLLITAIDPYLVNTFGSSREVVYLNIAKRPFDLLPMVVSMYALALWPVFRRLHASANEERLRKLFVSVILGSAGLVTVGGLAIIAARAPVYSYLSGGSVDPDVADLFFFLLLVVSTAVTLVSTNYLNAVGRIRSQSWVFAGGASVVIIAKILSLLLGDIHTFVMASAVSYLLCIALPLVLLCRRRRGSIPRPNSLHGEGSAARSGDSL